MPTSIKDMYRSAYKGETSWNQALLLTGMLYVGEKGIEVSPPPKNEADYHFYKLRFDSLSEFPNNNHDYMRVMEDLHKYIYNE